MQNNLIYKITAIVLSVIFWFPDKAVLGVQPAIRPEESCLSPQLNIDNPRFVQLIGFAADKNLLGLDLPQPAMKQGGYLSGFTLNELTAEILKRIKRDDFSLLKLDWELQTWEYQNFIKHAAAINSALNQALKRDCSPAFLEAAVGARMDMISHYQARLSPKGEKAFSEINTKLSAGLVAKEHVDTLMCPPQDWFFTALTPELKSMLWTKKRKEREVTVYVVGTWGCSTLCDICDGASLIKVSSAPGLWLQEIKSFGSSAGISCKLETSKNDLVRDYYDFVYDKDAFDIIEMFECEGFFTSGFEKGWVGERAVLKMLDKKSIQYSRLSIAVSVWMRKIGINKYMENINHVIDLLSVNPLEIEAFVDQRATDPAHNIINIVDELKLYNKTKRDNKIEGMIVFKTPEVQQVGRYLQLKKNGVEFINSNTTKNTDFLYDDHDNYLFIPDGQIMERAPAADIPDKGILCRNYKRVLDGCNPAREQIICRFCRLGCEGKNGCPGTKAFFEKIGLSPDGGVLSFDTLVECSI